jgi:hypothetical protein
MAFVHFQIVDALKANGKRRESTTLTSNEADRRGKMEVFIALRSCSNNT